MRKSIFLLLCYFYAFYGLFFVEMNSMAPLMISRAKRQNNKKHQTKDLVVVENNNEKLLTAIHRGSFDKVKRLLDAGADTNAIVYQNQDVAYPINVLIHSLLIGNSEKKVLEILDLLIQKGAGVNHVDYYGTPLFWAIKSNSLTIVKALLKAGALTQYSLHGKIVNLEDNKVGNKTIKEILDKIKRTQNRNSSSINDDDLSDSEDKENRCNDASKCDLTNIGNDLLVAVSHLDFREVKGLIQLGTRFGSLDEGSILSYTSPLIEVCRALFELDQAPERKSDRKKREDALNIMKFLLDKGFDVNYVGFYGPALYWAIKANSLKAVKLLLSYGADLIIKRGSTTIDFSEEKVDGRTVKSIKRRMDKGSPSIFKKNVRNELFYSDAEQSEALETRRVKSYG